ncbi:MAG: phosphotriesterase [Lachnospiraceae bacterium]|nr:phosphotriesterase [Lachnospiraceae bacterium]
MSKKITTVCGDIEPKDLGVTSLHEHTYLDMSISREFMKRYFPDIPKEKLAFRPENYTFLKSGTYLMSNDLAEVDDEEFLIKEYTYFKEAGGKSVCDCSPCGSGGDINRIVSLSKKLDLNIICATGIYTLTSRPPELLGKDDAFYYNYFKNEVNNGRDGTDIRPGMLKCAIATMDANGIMDGELAGVRACGKLSGETGLSVHIHTDPNIPGELVVETAKLAISSGAEPDKVHICHMDNRLCADVPVASYLTDKNLARNVSVETQKQLLDLGVTIGFDTFGMPLTNDNYFVTEDIDRLKALLILLDEGYENQITVGCDFSNKLLGRSYGSHGVARSLEYLIPMLKKYNKESAIQKIFVENPARILAY